MRRLILTLTIALGLTASSANAAIPDLSALGYQVHAIVNVTTGCKSFRAVGFGADETFDSYTGTRCDEAKMEAGMHAFAAGHPARQLAFEQENPPPPPPAEDPPPPPPVEEPTEPATTSPAAATGTSAQAASWTALVEAIAAGAAADEAALAARSAGLNVLYGLGD